MLPSSFAFFYLPQSASTASFLSRPEKELAFYRMQVDSSSVVNEKLNLKDSFGTFEHWMILAIAMCLGVPLQRVQLFLPQNLSRLGYDAMKTDLYTVAPNISGLVKLLILVFASGWTRWRFPFVVSGYSWPLSARKGVGRDDAEADLLRRWTSCLPFWGWSFMQASMLKGNCVWSILRRS